MWNIGVQWILAHNARIVHVSCECNEEEMHSRFRCAEKNFTL
jgi:hypothetical protein